MRRKHSRNKQSHQKKLREGSEDAYDYIDVISEENDYETSVMVEDKGRYEVTNENYRNSEVNAARCETCNFVYCSFVILNLLNRIIV